MTEMDQFKDLYIQTAREHLQVLNDTLLKLESDHSQLDLVEELMRAGHSLKGESAAMGFEQLATLGHVVEDLFTGIGNGSLAIADGLTDVLFEAFDHISHSLDAIAAPDGTELDCQEYVAKIKALTGLATEGFGKSAPDATPTPPPTTEPIPQTPVVNPPEEPEQALPPVEVPEVAPPVAPEPTSMAVPDVVSEEVASAPVSETPPPPPPVVDTSSTQLTSTPKSTANTEQISTVTLKVDKLDQMISVSEELVLLKMQLKTNAIVLDNANLKADIHRLDRLVTDMQFYVMQARLFPISLALHTIPRLVRDVSKKTNKQVRLVIEGEETTVDRTIIDHLTEPFVHMVRNSIDHGIEDTEAERLKAGKPAEATIKIAAYTRENKFYVDISDDGRGIEWSKLAKAAVKKGVISQEEVDSWTTDAEREQLLFQDGVSASETITDISGRGVGLSAVQKAIKKLGGSIIIKTQPGIGTTFTLRLPMTLAITQSLLVKVGTQTFAMPSNEVIRSIQIDRNSIQSAGNIAVIVVNHEQIPLCDLHALFDIPEADDEDSTSAWRTVVLVHQDQRILGCVVDRILSEEEILVKPLGPLLQHSVYFSGATILANGTAAPIINVEGLLWKA